MKGEMAMPTGSNAGALSAIREIRAFLAANVAEPPARRLALLNKKLADMETGAESGWY